MSRGGLIDVAIDCTWQLSVPPKQQFNKWLIPFTRQIISLGRSLRLSSLTLPILSLLSSKAQGCKDFCHVGIHWREFEGEMVIRALPTNLIQIFCGIILSSKVVVKSIIDLDEDFYRNLWALIVYIQAGGYTCLPEVWNTSSLSSILMTGHFNLGWRKEWICGERPITICPIVTGWTHARSTR